MRSFPIQSVCNGSEQWDLRWNRYDDRLEWKSRQAQNHKTRKKIIKSLTNEVTPKHARFNLNNFLLRHLPTCLIPNLCDHWLLCCSFFTRFEAFLVFLFVSKFPHFPTWSRHFCFLYYKITKTNAIIEMKLSEKCF